MIAFEKDSKPKIRDFADAKDLKEHFDKQKLLVKTASGDLSNGHIYILEGLDAKTITLLGEHFYIDP